MPSQKNVTQLQTLKDKLDSAKALILANYAGLSVDAQTQLRSAISETEGEFTVAKNNLLKIALKDKLKELPEEVNQALNGPTAVMFANSDAAASIKALANFIKNNERPEIKAGLLNDRVLSLSEIDQLSKLPSREQLLATLLAQLNAPTQSLAAVLAAPAQYLVYALNAITVSREAHQSEVGKNQEGGGE